MAFNPKDHMTNLKGKDYLEVKWRLVWFREEHPGGSITTDIVSSDPLVIRAVVIADGGVILATGHGSAQMKPGAVWSGREIEKAETAAIGRALGHAGYGTQFAPDDEGDHLADSPVERPQSNKNGSNSRFTQQQASTPTTAQNGAKSESNTHPSYKSNLGQVYGAVLSLYGGNSPHMRNSITGLERDGKLTEDMTVEQAVAAITAHKTEAIPS